MRLLWVTAEVPDTAGGGGNIRQANLLTRLGAHHDVDLVVAGRLVDDGVRNRLRSVVEVDAPPPLRPPEHNKWLQRGFDAGYGLVGPWSFEQLASLPARRRLRAAMPAVSGYDAVIVQHQALAPLRRRSSTPWVIEMHNVGSQYSMSIADRAAHGRHRWQWTRDAGRAAREERRIMRDYDLVVTMSADDSSALGGGVVVPNGVDLERFRPSPLPDDPLVVVTASWNYEPNIAGGEWFVDEVWPLVRAVRPDARLRLVGRLPDARVRALVGAPGVEAAFDVPDVVPHLAAARVAVVPVRSGSGTRLKAVEAMAMARPLVGTSIGLAGLDVVDGEQASVADEPRSMADAIVGALDPAGEASRLASAARAHVEGRFGWEAIAAGYLRHLGNLVASQT